MYGLIFLSIILGRLSNNSITLHIDMRMKHLRYRICYFNMAAKQNNNKSIAERFTALKSRLVNTWDYCSRGVWSDQRRSMKVNVIKTLNLTIRSFLSTDLQSKACALTYQTLLALVPALALVCAIARGFGYQDNIETILIGQFPSQSEALKAAFSFVDSYLQQASGGVFVGVGIVFLLWTLISLLRSVETTFNSIWLVSRGRSLWRMTTDYLAIFLILPILLICGSGLTLFMSTSLSKLLPFGFMQPAIEALFDLLSILLSCLFFAGTYMLIPNTKVQFKNAIIPGILVGISCQVLQWLFISGQMYVARYNAIYGSFSFLPLFLIWIQLVWLFTLAGAVLCFSIQNIGQYNYGDNISKISLTYKIETTLTVYGIIAQRFHHNMDPLSVSEISVKYHIPINLVSPIVTQLKMAGLVNFVETPEEDMNQHPVQPSCDISAMTVGGVLDKLIHLGDSDFLPQFNKRYQSVIELTNQLNKKLVAEADNTKIIDLQLNINPQST